MNLLPLSFVLALAQTTALEPAPPPPWSNLGAVVVLAAPEGSRTPQATGGPSYDLHCWRSIIRHGHWACLTGAVIPNSGYAAFVSTDLWAQNAGPQQKVALMLGVGFVGSSNWRPGLFFTLKTWVDKKVAPSP